MAAACSYHHHLLLLPTPIISSFRPPSLPITTFQTPFKSKSRVSSCYTHKTTWKQRGHASSKRNRAAAAAAHEDKYESSKEEEDEEEVPRGVLIWRAIKLPIYSVALVPLTVGSAAAYMQVGSFSVKRFLVLLASSILIITWLNLSNDVYDFDTGADKNKKESVVNMLGSRTGTLVSAYTLLAIGFMGLIWTCSEAGSIRSILLLTCSVICGYIYQCPPFRFSYQGLGEPLCFAAFGPFATTAFYLLQKSNSEMSHLPLSVEVLSASILVGFTTSLILLCSHFHQVDGDRTVGKMSPLVRIGTKAGSQLVKVAITTLYSLLFTLGLSRSLPVTCLVLCALTLPVGIFIVRFVEGNHMDKGKIFMAKYYCVRLHALFGTALSIGLVAARSPSCFPSWYLKLDGSSSAVWALGLIFYCKLLAHWVQTAVHRPLVHGPCRFDKPPLDLAQALDNSSFYWTSYMLKWM